MTKFRFVENLPDLIQPEEYADHPGGRLLRFRISVTGDGVEILGDAFRPEVLEEILAGLNRHSDGDDEIDQMLCGLPAFGGPPVCAYDEPPRIAAMTSWN